jgi:hypothetical protein
VALQTINGNHLLPQYMFYGNPIFPHQDSCNLHLSSYVGSSLGFKLIHNETFVNLEWEGSLFGLLSGTIKNLSTLDLGNIKIQTRQLSNLNLRNMKGIGPTKLTYSHFPSTNAQA